MLGILFKEIYPQSFTRNNYLIYTHLILFGGYFWILLPELNFLYNILDRSSCIVIVSLVIYKFL